MSLINYIADRNIVYLQVRYSGKIKTIKSPKLYKKDKYYEPSNLEAYSDCKLDTIVLLINDNLIIFNNLEEFKNILREDFIFCIYDFCVDILLLANLFYVKNDQDMYNYFLKIFKETSYLSISTIAHTCIISEYTNTYLTRDNIIISLDIKRANHEIRTNKLIFDALYDMQKILFPKNLLEFAEKLNIYKNIELQDDKNYLLIESANIEIQEKYSDMRGTYFIYEIEDCENINENIQRIINELEIKAKHGFIEARIKGQKFYFSCAYLLQTLNVKCYDCNKVSQCNSQYTICYGCERKKYSDYEEILNSVNTLREYIKNCPIISDTPVKKFEDLIKSNSPGRRYSEIDGESIGIKKIGSRYKCDYEIAKLFVNLKLYKIYRIKCGKRTF